MNLEELLKRLIWQENELYNLYKLGETFATFERSEFIEPFKLMAEEELRHRKILEDMLFKGSLTKTSVFDYLDSLELEPMLIDKRIEPDELEELVLEAIVREKHAYELYTKLASILSETLSDIFSLMAREELTHAYRLRLIYEAL